MFGDASSGPQEEKVREGRPPWTTAPVVGEDAAMDPARGVTVSGDELEGASGCDCERDELNESESESESFFREVRVRG